MEDVKKGYIIFEIYLTQNNSPPANFEIDKKYETYDEEEVLLLPQF